MPYQGGIKIRCICNVSSSFLRTCKRSCSAVNLVRPQVFHRTSILLDLYSKAYIVFLCQESVGKKDPYQAPHIARKKQKSPKTCSVYNAFLEHLFFRLIYERIFLVVSLCKKMDQRENTLFFNICSFYFKLFSKYFKQHYSKQKLPCWLLENYFLSCTEYIIRLILLCWFCSVSCFHFFFFFDKNNLLEKHNKLNQERI